MYAPVALFRAPCIESAHNGFVLVVVTIAEPYKYIFMG
jgi:hypothetical protein